MIKNIKIKFKKPNKSILKRFSKLKDIDYRSKVKTFRNKLRNINLKSKKVRKLYYISASIVVLIIILLLALPLFPAVTYKFNPPIDKLTYKLPVSSPFPEADNLKPVPLENRLIIPKIGVDTPIVEGSSLDILNVEEGVWREPVGKDPTRPGNMTLAGHRYQYLPPNMTTFYNLDKLQDGDKILVFWNKQIYIYNIYTTFEVTPDRVDILNDSEIPHELTLYTCTPIWTSTDRLVVKAKLIS